MLSDEELLKQMDAATGASSNTILPNTSTTSISDDDLLKQMDAVKPVNMLGEEVDSPQQQATDDVATTDVPEVSPDNDDAMIRDYLSSDDPYYTESYLRSLDTEKLSDILYEENPDLVNRHYKLPTDPLTQEDIAEISDGAELVAVDETVRMKARSGLTNALLASGITKDRKTALSMADDFVGNPNANSILESLGGADITPVGAVFALEEAVREMQKLSENDADAASYILPGLDAALSVLEGVLITKPLAKGVKGVLTGKRNVKTIDDILAESENAKNISEQETRDKYFNARMNISVARGATAEDIAAKTKAAEEVVAANRDIKNEFIQEFQDTTGKTISVADESGNLNLDPDLARQAGEDTLEEITQANKGTVREFLRGEVSQTDAALLATGKDTLTKPVLRADKLDGIVAAAADLKKQYPDAFAPRTWEFGPKKGKKYTVIDNLFELTVNKELVAGDELLDTLSKYNVSFEDYVLAVVNSGSEAGKILNKLSQIKRARPTNELIDMQEAATKEAQDAIRKNIMRIENIRRGGLVSQLATAARNLTSAGIRAPLEGLGNVMDTALYNLSEKGLASGAASMLSKANWSDSFRHMKYMFSPEYAMHTKDYVDFIMEQPALGKQASMLLNNINEIQRSTGRGEGGKLDASLTVLEDAVDALNTPNRWQEYLIRRGAFLGELERLTKREWGIDLIDTINQGKMRDLMNDASSVRPKDGRSFLNLVEDATNRAMDITYAKQPDIGVFRSTSQFIVRNGLTVVMPFPRFMFNSMELMGQYAAGASIPLTRKLANLVTMGRVGKGKLTAKDRQRISRNVVGMGVAGPIVPVGVGALLDDDASNQEQITDELLGMAAFGAFYQIRTMDEAAADYKMIKAGDVELDTTTQYPARQFLYIAEATRRLQEGTFNDFFDPREFAETFVGTNIRQGVGQGILQEVADLASDTDLVGGEVAARRAGRLLGNYLSTWAVPFGQIIEAQRGAGVRGTTMKDLADDPTLDAQTTFLNELSKPMKRFTTTPEEEAAAPSREYLFQEEKRRVAPMARVALGLSFNTADSEEGEYAKRLGLTEWQLGSTSRVPSIRNFENKVLRDAIPTIINFASRQEGKYRNQYRLAKPAVRKKYTEQAFVNAKIRPIITQQVRKLKTQLSTGKKLKADAPAYAKGMLEYRRLPPDIRKVAAVKFVEKYGREPDGTATKTEGAFDVNRLAEIGKAYRKVLSK